MRNSLDQYYLYKTLAGDTFDSIALDFYGQEFLSSRLIEANPIYRNVIVFIGGEEIKVPILDQPAADTLPPWKRT